VVAPPTDALAEGPPPDEGASEQSARETALFRKVAGRLLPFLGLLYFFSILDRSNIDQARLQMVPEVMDQWAYALGAGIFYIGYVLLEVPSNLMLRRFGARRWIARILVSWGVISAAMMFVAGAWSFIGLRFLLGCAEAGFFPGVVLYLTYWFPPRQRARATALFMVAAPLVWMAGGPLTGALLHHMHGVWGLAGWQWMFLLEGLPSIVLGLVTYVYLTDRPDLAGWLSPVERHFLTERIALEAQPAEGRHSLTFREALADVRIWRLIALFAMNGLGISVLGFYFSTIVRDRFPTLDDFEIGLLKAASGTASLIAIVVVGASSDRTGERRGHIAGAAFAAAVGFGMSMANALPVVSFLGVTLAHSAMLAIWGPFWSLATTRLGGRASAGGIAFINAVGNLGAVVGPILMASLGIEIGLAVTACLLTATGLLALIV
jgi:MFS transporter, ACS family, tartrate transporter